MIDYNDSMTNEALRKPGNQDLGILVISLDFELHWGVLEKKTTRDYEQNLLGVRTVIPSILRLFDEYHIHATWATVGLLFFETRDELIKALPAKNPHYVNNKLSPYNHINSIGNNEQEDPFHHGPSLIKTIRSFAGQEIGSHTFSHYYCLEPGQNGDTFRDDLEAAIRAGKRYNMSLESLVFPRNQFRSDYIAICREMGIKAYRGNQRSWIYRAAGAQDRLKLIKLGLRLADVYLNISGHNCYSPDEMAMDSPISIPASRYLRPYSQRLRLLEPLRLRRILSDLTYAAKKGLVYHLWWHPHDFGINQEQNLQLLKSVLEHYMILEKAFGMQSLNMGEVSRRLVTVKHVPR